MILMISLKILLIKFSKKYYDLNKNDSIVKMIINIQYDF